MITSLHSPHVEVVKALLGSRGGKERSARSLFVIEGASHIRAAINSDASSIESLYLTEEGRTRISDVDLTKINVIDVSSQVMAAMTDTVTPQGVLALAKIPQRNWEQWLTSQQTKVKIAYFWQLQDPGNAGTVIRAADAFGFDAVFFSDNSVDVYSPKVVRSSVGSHWHIPIFQEVEWNTLSKSLDSRKISAMALTAAASQEEIATIAQRSKSASTLWIFGNEARGLPDLIVNSPSITKVRIPMFGQAESLNLATAASVVMYEVAQADK